MIHRTINRRDAFKPWYVFRSAMTGRYVSRIFALLNPAFTVKERRWK